MMHPVGPQSAQTYWARRALVAVVAVALVVALTWWLVARGSGPDSDTAAASNLTTSTGPALTGVLATETASGLGDVSMQFDDPWATTDGEDTQSTGADEAGTSDATGPTTDAAVAGAATTATNASRGVATTETPAAPVSSGSAAAADTAAQQPAAGTSAPVATTAADADAAIEHAPPTATVVETTNPAPVTVTVTKQVPASTAQPKPTTTAPPPPSYDANGTLICPDSAIRITATALASSLFVGAQPRLGMTVTNVGAEKCVRDVSGALQSYTVLGANGAHVWSTNDCFPGVGHEIRVLAPKSSVNYVIKWAGTSSTPKTCTPRAPVKAGKYTLVAQLGALKSKPLAFTMK